MDLTEITSVPVIVTVVYGLLTLYKHCITSEKLTKIIPLLAVLLGTVLGIVFFYASPELIPAKNVVFAALIGGVSGLAATGTNQIFKQLTKANIVISAEKPLVEEPPVEEVSPIEETLIEEPKAEEPKAEQAKKRTRKKDIS